MENEEKKFNFARLTGQTSLSSYQSPIGSDRVVKRIPCEVLPFAVPLTRLVEAIQINCWYDDHGRLVQDLGDPAVAFDVAWRQT